MASQLGDVEKLKSLTAQCYQTAAEQGDTSAQYNLALCLEKGEGVTKDKKAAAEWFRRAAKQGHVVAQYNLFICLMNGDGVERDQTAAVEWLRRAAEQGHAEAQFNLAVYLEDGDVVVGIAKDERAAVAWYRKAAELGFAKAQFNLAVCLDEGAGVEEDQTAASMWYQKAAEQGDVDAQYELALRLEEGQGVTKDKKAAAEWFRRAADQGNNTVTPKFIIKLITEEDSEGNREEALTWCQKYAEKNLHSDFNKKNKDDGFLTVNTVKDLLRQLKQDFYARKKVAVYLKDNGNTLVFINLILNAKAMAGVLKVITFVLDHYPKLTKIEIDYFYTGRNIDSGRDYSNRSNLDADVVALLKILQSRCQNIVSFSFASIGYLINLMQELQDDEEQEESAEPAPRKMDIIFPELLKLFTCMTMLTNLELEELGPFPNLLTQEQGRQFSNYLSNSRIQKFKLTDCRLSKIGDKKDFEPTKTLLRSIEQSKTITELDLSSDSFGLHNLKNKYFEEFLNCIIRIVYNNRKIKILKLNDFGLSMYMSKEKRGQKLLERLLTAIQKNTTLITLHLRDKHFVPSESDPETMRYVSDRYTGFEWSENLLRSVYYHSTLQELRLWQPEAQLPKNFQSLLTLIPHSSLRSFDFGTDETTPLQYEQFSKALLLNKSTSHLELNLRGFYHHSHPFEEAALINTLANLAKNKNLHSIKIRIDFSVITKNLFDNFKEISENFWDHVTKFFSQNQTLRSLTLSTRDVSSLEITQFKKLFQSLLASSTLDTLNLCRTRWTDLTLAQYQALKDLIPHKDDPCTLVNLQFLGPDLTPLDLSYHRPRSQQWADHSSNLALRCGLFRAAHCFISGDSKWNKLPVEIASNIVSYLTSPMQKNVQALCWQAPRESLAIRNMVIKNRKTKEAAASKTEIATDKDVSSGNLTCSPVTSKADTRS